MRIINFIKNYPCIVITAIIISIGMTIICTPYGVYAKESEEKSKICSCHPTFCNGDSCKYNASGQMYCPLKQGDIININCEIEHTTYCFDISQEKKGCCDNGCDCNNICSEYCGTKCEKRTVKSVGGCKNGKCVAIYAEEILP